MAMADEIKRISANGTEFAYVEFGQGEPVIFVHGGLQDYRMWTEHLPKFAGHVPASGRRAAQGGWNPQEPFQTEKAAKHSKMTKHGHFAEIASRQCFCQGVFTQPRPKGDIRLGHLSKSRREVLRATGRRNPHIVGGSPQAYP
jgi:pimeloyl-ACP methyl ester carboxylesterase